MSILSLARFVATLVSLAILSAAAYLLWSWQAGDLVRDAETGVAYRDRETWRLWAGLALLAWSFVGRFVVLPLCSAPDLRKSVARYGEGTVATGVVGGPVYVEKVGPAGAQPIIFTHGWGMDSTFWDYARRDLADRFRLILWDLPGLGRSRPAGKAAIGLEPFAAQLAALIEQAGPAKPVLVGHSIGGMTIQTLIRDQPGLQERIAGVVLLNTTYTNPLKTMVLSKLLLALQRPVLEPAARLTVALQPIVWVSKWQSYLSGSAHLAHRLGFGRFVTRSQLEHATLLSTRNPPGSEARGNLAMFHWDATAALTRARVPILVIGGDKDIVTKLEASRAIEKETDMATLHVVEDVNHMGPMERADLYNALIAEFALRVQPGASHDLARRSENMVDGSGQGPGAGAGRHAPY
jgi:pimeloyl-ACP methyl ester carboxylesterase